MPSRLPTLFISHGGGPCFSMEMLPPFPKDTFDRLGAYLRGLQATLGFKPKAVVVISGHWEAERATVNTAAHPPLLFDYYGFPEHTYHLQYPAAGMPQLAAQVRDLLVHAGIECDTEGQRGFDHGIFVPFMLIYPQADVPIVQLSLRSDLDPAAHLAIGRALAPLRDQDVFIVGSGMSYHNLRELFSGGEAASKHFDDWLNDAVTDPDPQSRNHKLTDWEKAPDARLCHPREDHLMPLMVVVGAAGDDKGHRVYNDIMLGKAVSCFQFG